MEYKPNDDKKRVVRGNPSRIQPERIQNEINKDIDKTRIINTEEVKKQPEKNVPRVVRMNTEPVQKLTKKEQAIAMAKSTGKGFLIFCLILLITCCIVGSVLTVYIVKYVDSEPDITLNDLKMNYTSMIYGLDKDGNEVEVQSLKQGEERVWVDLKNVPQTLLDAVVYTEDERFMQHTGVDFKRTFGAFFNEFKNMVTGGNSRYGGSTITQQLIKNINGDLYSRNIDNKVKEIMQALNLERHYSKEQILESYINYIGLGNGISGVQAGAKYYFGKDVKDLTKTECVALAVISKSPSKYNPKDGPENNKTRRQYAFEKLLEFGSITQQEYDELVNSDVTVVTPKEEDDKTSTAKKAQSYFVDALIEEVIADLRTKYNYTYEQAEQFLMSKGVKVHSTMEVETQATLEKHFEDTKTFKIGNSTPPQASMVIMDYSGNVRALVGGTGTKQGNRIFNRATQAKRGFGSTVKPLSVYSLAIENNVVDWSTIVEDQPITIKNPDGTTRTDYPNNYNKVYEGNITLIKALRMSKNTVPVRLLDKITFKTSFDFLKNDLHFNDIKASGSTNNLNYGSLALGDAPTTLVDLTNAYQIFGNNGYFTDHKMYTKVVGADGSVLLDATTREKKQVISTQTAYVMNRGLVEVMTTGTGAVGNIGGGWETAGKTGTSSNEKDYLLMGLTPDYVAGIRYGYDDNSDIVESTSHKLIWKNIMKDVLKNKTPRSFDLNSTGVVEAQFCTKTGLLANSGCPKEKGYYKSDNVPEHCTEHK